MEVIEDRRTFLKFATYVAQAYRQSCVQPMVYLGEKPQFSLLRHWEGVVFCYIVFQHCLLF